MTSVGYIRVSSTGQNLDSQRDKVAAHADKIFEEKRSGVDQHRPELKACLAWLREGDTLYVTKADRISRSAGHLLSVLDDLTKRGVDVVFIDQPQLSTADKYGKFMLSVLAGVAELEREIIRERQTDGIKAAQARGVKFGRPPKVSPDAVQRIRQMKADGRPLRDIKTATGLGKTTIYEILKES